MGAHGNQGQNRGEDHGSNAERANGVGNDPSSVLHANGRYDDPSASERVCQHVQIHGLQGEKECLVKNIKYRRMDRRGVLMQHDALHWDDIHRQCMRAKIVSFVAT